MKGPPPQLFLPSWFAREICLMGQLDKTCKYLSVGENGYSCCKLIPEIREKIDELSKTFTAKGDNCPGTPMINPKFIRNN
jgi:hypothetical protein